MPDRIRSRVLVVGSGVAGLHAAWRASALGEVLLLTKRSLFDSATAYAQGGIAAALGAGDSPSLHRRDTLAAGAALGDAAAVAVLTEEGPTRVRDLQTALGLVASGAGVAVVPASARRLGRDDVAFVDLDEPGMIAPIVMCSRVGDKSAELAQLRKLIREFDEWKS